MSTHTDGAPPSVRSAGAAADPPAATDGVPPRPRRPAPPPAGSSGEDTGAVPDPATPSPPAGSPTSGDPAPSGAPVAGPAARGRRSRRAAEPADGSPDQGWLQQEIARRVAENGVSDTGRHARAALGAGEAPPATPETPATPATPETHAPPAAAPAAATGEPSVDDEDDTRVPRAVPGRARSGAIPDPYAPGGLREPDGGPPHEEGTGPEPVFRLAGPAAAPAPPGTPTPPGPPASPPPPAPAAPSTPDGAKQWPPASGASGLPRRVPGAGWTLDRATLLGGTARLDTDTETRPVPSTWSAAGRRPDPLDPPHVEEARADLAGPPTTDLGPRLRVDLDEEDDLDDDWDDLDDLDDEDDDLGGPEVERTAVIWRAPGLEEDEPATAPRDTAVAPSQGSAPPEVARPQVTPSENPYTGAGPRGFVAAPTDPEPAQDADDGPEGRRVRVVLSERRTTAQSVRPVVDVQDPGSVGTTLRNGLVSNQLGLAVRVFGVALLGLGLLPALFAAFPSIGEISVVGLRVPWLLLGFLVYPFLLGLGWWYVNSAERVEQDFAEGVQDR